MMSGIRGRDTKPELVVRRGLHALGHRYRIHDKTLPGKPDLVFSKRRAVVFVHGCFWHGHDCHLFRWPRTRTEFWRTKIEGNVTRDVVVMDRLHELGWRTGIVWECAIKGRAALDPVQISLRCSKWLSSDEPELVVLGNEQGAAF